MIRKKIGENFLILGLGRATSPIVKFLLARKNRVFAYDLLENKKQPFLCDRNFTFVPPDKIPELPEPLTIIISPGISEDSEIALLAKEKGRVISDVEFVYQILAERREIKVVAITGTNGKSTTTALLGAILKRIKKEVFVGGNIAPGKPAGAALFEKKDTFIFETSSFQLEKIKEFRPNIAILLNVKKDHLDRYGCWRKYIMAKANIFLNQKEGDIAVLNYDDPQTRRIAQKIKSNIFWFSLRQEVNGIYWKEGISYIKFFGEKEIKLFQDSDILLRGKFNLENILAASLVAYLLGVTKEEIIEGIKNFPGLPHRMEFVRKINGVSFVNNSMATNPSAFGYSLSAFFQPVILIAGGKNKGFSFSEYVKPIEKHVKFLVLIGEVKDKLFDLLPLSVRRKTYLAPSLKKAVEKAFAVAQKDDVILFSPGFSSFDMFKDFIDRGNSFKKIVRSL